MKNVGEPCAGEPHARFDGEEKRSQGHRASPSPYAMPAPTRPPDGLLIVQPDRAVRKAKIRADWATLGEYHFDMRRARIRVEAVAIVLAALFAVGPAGVASAGCSGFGPYADTSCGSTSNGDPSQSGSSSWPPDANSGDSWPPSINSSSGGGSTSSGGGSTHATPIVPVSAGP